jgi:hypothetical protein
LRGPHLHRRWLQLLRLSPRLLEGLLRRRQQKLPLWRRRRCG